MKRPTRYIPKSFANLRKQLLNFFNGSPRKMNYTINERIIDRYFDIANSLEKDDERGQMMVTLNDQETNDKIDLINNRLGTTYRQLYIIEVTMYLKEIKEK